MDYYKINKRGQITIPKYIRDEYGWTTDIPLDICMDDEKIIIKPSHVCCQCRKPLTKELALRGACISCTPPKITVIY